MLTLRSLSAALAPWILVSSAHANLLVVDAAGQGDFTTIQAAVDAALDGDLIVVRAGSYPAFSIDDKQLTIVRESEDLPHVAGPVEIKNLSASRFVLIGGLSMEGASNANPTLCKSALQLTNDQGGVRVQNSRLTGGNCTTATDHPEGHPGRSAVVIENAADVAFASCEAQGGYGGGISFLWLDSYGGAGGHGIVSTGSNVAIYDCTLRGGAGGDGAIGSGDGGDGLHVVGGQSFASKTSFQGGVAGIAWGDASVIGESGRGVRVGGLGSALLLDPSGASVGPGIQFLSGSGRTFTVSEVNDPASGVRVAVQGVPGDRVYLSYGRRPAFHITLAWSGVLLLPFPAPLNLPSLGTIPASGVLFLEAPLGPLASGENHRVDLIQGVVISADNRKFLGAGLTLVRIQ